MYTIYEDDVEARPLPGRKHKMIIGPDHFGGAKRMCFGTAEFPPKTHAPGHVHSGAEEIIYVVSGEGRMYFDGACERLGSGVCVYIPPGVVHSIENSASEPMKLAYVFSPPVAQGSYDKEPSRRVEVGSGVGS